ncbi:methyl-accepting chemotaxis sensory transducer [Rhizobium freirei PRF 81]|uniref:Methyl-accepting chemotaxis sensory transducer n=1 Tax=Rhizobium freirei PRF 81 TaxID=363754 RepID=N6VF50_9HYPH|nr:HAMP domain-containing methyl-accepting chemotaxis protein [Rhizobium freirei]ENN89727.1 methyl-accepting chemotaxis sensory transducer [Rhizobium freirei PRF 81]
MSFLNRMSILSKLLSVIIFMSLIIVACIWYATAEMRMIDNSYTAFLDHEARAVANARRTNTFSYELVYNVFRAIAETDPDQIKRSSDAFDSTVPELKQILADLRQQAPAFSDRIDDLGKKTDLFINSVTAVMDLVKKGQNKEAVDLYHHQVDPSFHELSLAIRGLTTDIQSFADKGSNALTDKTNATRFLTATSSAAGLGAGFVMAIIAIVFGISKPMAALRASMARLASNETNIQIPGMARGDELGQMAGAVEVFRQAAIANERLEAEAEASRSQSEADRLKVVAEAEAAAQERLREATAGLANGLKLLAAGDLSFQLTEPFAPDFETLRHDLNATITQLSETLREVARSTASIDSGSREISRSADDLSQRTEKQAASLEETAAALDQITVNVSNSSKRAEEARAVAIQANASAARSGKVVANAVEAMSRIEQSSNQIANIIGVIDEIAFQTNLLALNAGVEAARAGDAGKGFAVVAQEVRELAQRSALAAKEIKDLIRNSTTEVESGVKLVRDTGDVLHAIEQDVVIINQHMDAIATSAREQSTGLAEVNTAVNQMDQVTQQNAAMVEETNAAGATLAVEAGRLKELIAGFKLSGNQPAVRAIDRATKPIASPARALGQKLAGAFGGRTAVAASAKEWEEF